MKHRNWKTVNSNIEKNYQSVISVFIVSLCILSFFLVFFLQSYGDISVSKIQVVAYALAGVISVTFVYALEDKWKYAKCIYFVPWVILFVFSKHGYIHGFITWMNILIQRWNLVHSAGIRLFQVTSTLEGIQSFAYLFSLVLGQFITICMKKKHFITIGIFVLICLFASLSINIFSNLFCLFFIISLLSMGLLNQSNTLTKNSFRWLILTFVCFGVSMQIVSEKELNETKIIRKNAKEAIHEVRFGKNILPEGDLNKPLCTYNVQDNLMTVQSLEEKNMYLKAYTGAVLKENQWQEFSDDVYGGDNTGMLTWLKSKGFNPLSQSAQYYSLCEDKKDLNENLIRIQVSATSRYYIYSPASIKGNGFKTNKDLYLYSNSLFGQREYEYNEISEARPNELNIVENWVNHPQNDEQKEYVEAEAVYRNFVYENYLETDNESKDIVHKIFWDKYSTDSEGIYSAVTNIRKVLANNIQYNENADTSIPENKNPILYYLNESKTGNSMTFSTLAIEALRDYGIPARYAEGYYIPSSRFSENENGSTAITYKDVHAWVEVYFDGIGWQPIDFTPGFYYEPVTLQNMVGKPNAVRRTAALEDSIFGGDLLNDGTNGQKKDLPPIVQNAVNIGLIILGAFALIAVLLTILIVLAELFRFIVISVFNKKFKEKDEKNRIEITAKTIYRLLDLYGIDATVGWNTEAVDQVIVDRFQDSFKEGDYANISRLIEKRLCGDIPLEEYEKRTLYSFVHKLYDARLKENLLYRLKIRYAYFKLLLKEN